MGIDSWEQLALLMPGILILIILVIVVAIRSARTPEGKTKVEPLSQARNTKENIAELAAEDIVDYYKRAFRKLGWSQSENAQLPELVFLSLQEDETVVFAKNLGWFPSISVSHWEPPDSNKSEEVSVFVALVGTDARFIVADTVSNRLISQMRYRDVIDLTETSGPLGAWGTVGIQSKHEKVEIKNLDKKVQKLLLDFLTAAKAGLPASAQHEKGIQSPPHQSNRSENTYLAELTGRGRDLREYVRESLKKVQRRYEFLSQWELEEKLLKGSDVGKPGGSY
ncbi:MAG: hypothetical protein Q8O76_02570, partial [Chloroflexota bacterium]|nr:hypothetical protein [Chloroflexota bacterium]